MAQRVVLAYSGGLDTSAIVPWLRERYGATVICVAADVGQGAGELRGLEEKARRSGAESCLVEDVRDRFVREFIWPTLKAGDLRANLPARDVHGAAADRRAPGGARAGWGARPWRTAARARATTRCGSNSPTRRSRRISGSSRHGGSGSSGVGRPAGVSQGEGHSHHRDRGKAVQPRPQLWHISHEGGSLEDPWSEPPDDITC